MYFLILKIFVFIPKLVLNSILQYTERIILFLNTIFNTKKRNRPNRFCIKIFLIRILIQKRNRPLFCPPPNKYRFRTIFKFIYLNCNIVFNIKYNIVLYCKRNIILIKLLILQLILSLIYKIILKFYFYLLLN